MTTHSSGYVFFAECRDIGEAQIIKSFLESQGFHPRVRDEQTRSVAPHFGQVLGKLTLEIPEIEFLAASHALEEREKQRSEMIIEEEPYIETQEMAKKALWNAILGLVLIPLLCTFYSMSLGFRVLRIEKPLTPVSRKRLMVALALNSLAVYIWMTLGPAIFKQLKAF